MQATAFVGCPHLTEKNNEVIERVLERFIVQGTSLNRTKDLLSALGSILTYLENASTSVQTEGLTKILLTDELSDNERDLMMHKIARVCSRFKCGEAWVNLCIAQEWHQALRTTFTAMIDRAESNSDDRALTVAERIMQLYRTPGVRSLMELRILRACNARSGTYSLPLWLRSETARLVRRQLLSIENLDPPDPLS